MTSGLELNMNTADQKQTIRRRPGFRSLVLFCLGAWLAADVAFACTAVGGGGPWNSAATWTGCGGGIPNAGSHVVINRTGGSPELTDVVTIPAGFSAVAASVTLGNSGTQGNQRGNSLVLATASSSLTVSGAFTIYKPSGGDNPNVLAVNAGSVTVGSLALSKSVDAFTQHARVEITTGSLLINGALSADGAANTAVIDMTGGGGTLRLNGAFNTSAMTLAPGTASTFIYGGANQTALLGVSEINYHNLTFAGSGTKSQTTWATPTITGTTTVNAGVTFNNSASVNYAGPFVNNGTVNASATHDYQGNFVNNGTYTNSAGGGQNYRANFTNSGTFNAGAGLHRFNGSVPQVLTGATTFQNMEVNNSAGLTLNADVLVQTQLNLATGVVTTGSNVLRVSQTGWSGVNRTAGWVAGNLGLWMPTGWQSRVFDIGAPDAYRPLNVSLPNTTSAAGFLIASISQSAGDHPQIGSSGLDAARSVNRWWTLSGDGLVTSNMEVTFNYLAGDIDVGANPQLFEIERFAGGSWSPVTVGARTGTSTQGTGITGFGQFAIAEPAVAVPPSECPTGFIPEGGLPGDYYNWTGGSPPTPPTGTPDGVRVDGPIDFDWGAGAPGVPGIGADQFFVRWEGFVRVNSTGNYQFQTVSDDGVRLWVNNQLLIDNWTDHAATTDTSGSVQLQAGALYPIRLEYYENFGQAVIRLRMGPTGGPFPAIPAGPTPTLGQGLYHCVPEPDASLVAHYRMDEPAWTGAAGQVEDSSGNSNHGTAVGGASTAGASPAIPGDPGTCRYGEFDGVNDYVNVPGLSSYLNGTASLAFWIRTTQVGSDTAWVAPGVAGVELSGGTDDIFWGWLDASGRIGLSVGDDFANWKSTTSVNNGAWHHVALTRDHDAGTFQIFVNGVLENSGGIAGGLIGTPFSSIGRVEDTGAGDGNYFQGNLDEVRIYDGVLDGAQVVAIMNETHPCDDFVDHYTITHAGTGITCEAEPVTIVARDIDGNPVPPPAGTQIVLATNPASGVWVGGNTHTFNGSDTTVVRSLQQTTPATLIIELSDGTLSAVSDPLTFLDTGLRFYGNAALDPIAHQVAAVPDSNPILRAVRTNTDTGACEGRVQGSQTVGLAYECRNPDTCVAGQSLTVAGSPAQANNSGDAIGYAPVTLTFDANGVAAIPINYSDVGQLRLHAQLALSAQGDDPAVTLNGTSNEFVVRPYTLFISSVTTPGGTPNPGTTSGGSGFVAAGENFHAQVEVRNADGNVTPNFGRESAPESVALNYALVYPSGGDTGTLGGVNSGAVTDGVVAFESLVWDQVGALSLQALLVGGNYLGTGNIVAASNSVSVGRIYPHHYHFQSSSVVTSCSGFSYMDQPAMEVSYQLQARTLGGGITSNYDNIGLGYAQTATVGYAAENDNEGDGGDWGGRLNIDLPGGWEQGILEFFTDEAYVARAAVPDGPYDNLQLGLLLSDALDDRPLNGLNMNPVSDDDCSDDDSCTHVALGAPFELRHGRLRLDSAFGLETDPLPVRFVTQYWNNGNWSDSVDDNCTRVSRSAITYPEGSIDIDANLEVTVGGGTSTGEYTHTDMGVDDDIVFSGGDAGHTFTAPGAGNIGNFNVRINLQDLPWLQYDWNRDGNPDAEIDAIYGFGRYRGQDRIIYWREVLQ